MKFAVKIAAATMALLCVTLGAGGAHSVRQNFAAARAAALNSCAAEHRNLCFSMETALADGRDAQSDAPLASPAIAAAAQELTGPERENAPMLAALTQEGSVLWATLPVQVPYAEVRRAMDAGETGAVYCRADGRYWLLMATPLQGQARPLWLAQAWDVSHLFTERDRQVRQQLLLSAAALAAAGAAAAAVSVWLTRPLRALDEAARALAAGDGHARAQVASGDELESLGESFNRMADAIGGQMEALRAESARQKRFVAAFSHELKTPMTTLLGYASMLRQGQLAPQAQQTAAGHLYREAARLEALSGQLLRLMGLEAGGCALEETSLPAVLHAAADSLPDLPAQLCLACPRDARALANAPLLIDLVRNLVLNAAAAAPCDGKVRAGCTEESAAWTLWVEDKGRGIPAEALAHVTEPFYRVDAGRARSAGGAGLGLALCRQIAQAHGSELHIESRAGRGTRVWLTLKKPGAGTPENEETARGEAGV